MIPIPPTTRLIPAIAPSSSVSTPVTWLATWSRSSCDWTVKSSWAVLWRSRRISPICSTAALVLAWSTAWTLIVLTLRAPRAVRWRRQPRLHRRDRDDRQVVLVAEAGPALALHHADDAEVDPGPVADRELDALADRVGVAEQVVGDRRAEHDHARAPLDVLARDEVARGDVEVAHVLVLGGRAEDAACCSSARSAISWANWFSSGATAATAGARPGSASASASSKVSVGALPWPVRTPPCWVAPGRTKIRLVPCDWMLDGDRRLGAAADRHQGDDRADADHDAEHRQRRAQLVGAERAQRDADRLEQVHAATWPEQARRAARRRARRRRSGRRGCGRSGGCGRRCRARGSRR